MPASGKPNSRYMPGLDGLRALALISVMGYHWGFGFAGGGFLGVSLFFVLSGYLITDILASQWHHQGRIDLKDFWIRRFRRLLPAMLVMLILVVAWVTLFDRERLAGLRGDVLGAMTYISNWQFIFQEQSYFESFGPPSPLGHFWSLAVEEQFYLLWPLIMLAGLKLFPRRGPVFALIAAGVILSAAAMAILYDPGTDPSRVYYGTDTRAFGLLSGAALAILWPSRKLSGPASPAVKRKLNLIGLGALLVVLFMMGKADRYDPFLYRGGMLFFSVAAAVLIAVLAHPASTIAKWFGWKPLLWLGVRSYGIYLWHYPVMILFSPPGGAGELSLPQTALQIAASIGLAALSYKYVEEPIRRGGFRKLKERATALRKRPQSISVKGWVVSFSSLAVIVIFCTGMMSSVSAARTAGNLAAMLELPGDGFTVDMDGTGPPGVEGSGLGGETQPPAEGSSYEPVGPGDGEASGALPAGGEADGEAAGTTNGEPPGPPPPSGPAGSAKPADSAGHGNPPVDVGDTAGVGAGGKQPANQQDAASGKSEDGQGNAADDEPKSAGEDGEKPAGNSGKSPAAPRNDAADSSGKDSSGSSKPEDNPSAGGADDSGPGGSKQPDRPNSVSPPKGAATTNAVSAIGDSVMLGVSPYLEKAIPGIHVDAAIGRQMRQASASIPGLQAKGRIKGGVVIIGLGTNGAFPQKDLDALLKSLEPAQRVLLVNTRVPRDWEKNVNDMLAAAAARYPNVKLVDWYAASKGHPEYFREDGVHLEPAGAAAYTSLVLEALR